MRELKSLNSEMRIRKDLYDTDEISFRGSHPGRDRKHSAAGECTDLKVILAGSSAIWQSMALGAYNAGKCVSGGTAPCFHYTNSSFNLTDTRPTTKGGTTAVEARPFGSSGIALATPNVWAYIKVDSGVGDRCYFAQPHCNVNIATFPAAGNLISLHLWGDNSSDSTPPAAIQALASPSGTLLVNAAATDIRPEDALFATCRANSKLGGGTDGLAGLGYGSNTSGVCPAFGLPLANLREATFSALTREARRRPMFWLSPQRKRSVHWNRMIAGTTISVGAAPIIFITQRTGALATVTNATDAELQASFRRNELQRQRLWRAQFEHPGLPARAPLRHHEHHGIHRVPLSKDTRGQPGNRSRCRKIHSPKPAPRGETLPRHRNR